MSEFIGGAGQGSASGTQTFGQLTIEKRVLLTPARTIFIPNISTISVGTSVEDRSTRYAIAGIICLLGAGTLVYTNPSVFNPLSLLLLFAGIGILIFAFSPPDKTDYLIISTNDGTRSQFTGPNLQTLEQVRRILSDKINADDETSTFNINFEKGTIETLSVGSLGSIETGAIVTGSNNMVATNSPGAMVGSTETSYSASNSPGAVVGTGNTVGTNTVAVQHVDYSSVLPTIEEWQRYYAQRADTQKLAERLSELEVLMRSGTPSPESKGRVRTLAGELSQILQGYPPAVQLFESVMRLVGG